MTCRFRWVQCQIQELSALRTDRAVRQALKSLPRDLDETYERILSRIAPNDAIMAKRALMALVYASRPLLLDELAELAIIETGIKELDPEARLRDSSDIIDICGSLVLHRSNTSEVVLSHHSVKDFLCSVRCQAKVEFYHLQDTQSNITIAKLCLTYLLLQDFAKGPVSSAEALISRYSQYPLLDYAARHWCDHVASAFSSDAELGSLTMELMDSRATPHFFAWIQELVSKPQDGGFNWNYYPKNATPLYFAASFGLLDVVRKLLTSGININERGGSFGGTALHAAVWRDHINIAEVLIEAGADVKIQDVNMATAEDLARFKTFMN